MSSCLICEKHLDTQQKPIKSGNFAKLYHCYPTPKEPSVYKGHLFVEPTRHITCTSQLKDEEAREIGLLISMGAKVVRDFFNIEHIYTFNIGHMVPHLHFHIVPRYPDTPEEFWGGMSLHQWPDAPFIGKTEVDKINQVLIDAVSSIE